jgi:hypothetical protein
MIPRRAGMSRLASITIVVLASACTHVTYRGPRRPRNEVAEIEGYGAEIAGMDRIVYKRSSSKVEVLPGNHVLLMIRTWKTL